MSKYLYISALSSDSVISDIYRVTRSNPGYAIQKFSRLLVDGFVCNGIDITAYSVPPVTRHYTKRIWVNKSNEVEDGIRYEYMPFINIPVLKHLCIFICSFFNVLKWGLKGSKDKAIICDVLCVSSSMGSLLASKLCNLKSVAVVTDIFDQMVGQKSTGLKALLKKLAGVLNRIYVSHFDKYILLTEAMNGLVNPKDKSYIVMEGLCDKKLVDEKFTSHKKSYPKVVMYAGGLEERYGMKILVDAFKTIQDEDIELHLYGSGSYVDQLIMEIEKDNRIKFWGVKANAEIVEAEYRATLLVNPRFTTEEFTKYSFPSKNIEYMVSGTPLLTTKLPGMSEEYYPYIYLIEDETVEGYAKTLSDILRQSDEILAKKGRIARDFVLNKKNNVNQAGRIIEFINRR